MIRMLTLVALLMQMSFPAAAQSGNMQSTNPASPVAQSITSHPMGCLPAVSMSPVCHPTVYKAEKGALSAGNLLRYNNRPLYCTNTTAFVLAGDKPLIRLVQAPFVHGAFMLAFIREGQGCWLQDFDSLRFFYSAGMAKWAASDTRFPGVSIELGVAPVRGKAGMALRAAVHGAKPGDSLRWMFGGAELRMNGATSWQHSMNLAWEFDPLGHPELSGWTFQPGACEYNTAIVNKNNVLLHPRMDSLEPAHFTTTAGACSDMQHVMIIDAGHWQDPLQLQPVAHPRLPALLGTIPLGKTAEYFWSFGTYTGDGYTCDHPVDDHYPGNHSIDDRHAGHSPIGNRMHGKTDSSKFPATFSARADWEAAAAAATREAGIVFVHTPDGRLNELASISGSVIDALWHDSAYVHGGMLWNIPFPGWRVLFGATMYGWHDRVRTEAHYYLSSQTLKSDLTRPKADPALLLTGQAAGSRFYGVGRIQKNQAFYNMQSQFFDQLISEWRHTGDTAFERMLRPALELHLQWETDCFDPDGDGLYESYLNTWPSDSQWYSGGGTAEESAYAYKGHEAAADMASRMGDTAMANRHRSVMQKIRAAFFNRLWVAEKGHPGASREQLGYQRLHEDPWLYSIFLPIDAGMEDPLQSATSLYYTQWALQNDAMPAGGRRVWTSNWVPGLWSVREMYPGDNYHLALAYFLAGFPEEGWDIMKGTFLESAFNGAVPGNFGAANSGTDFGDCSHMFARALVEGLFGFRPNYPRQIVTIAPQLPAAWDSARIHIADYDFRFIRRNNQVSYEIGLKQSAALDLFLPITALRVKEVRVNGRLSDWQWLPGFGQSIVHCRLPSTKHAHVTILTEHPEVDSVTKSAAPLRATLDISRKRGDTVQQQWPSASGLMLEDPQHVLAKVQISGGRLRGTVTGSPGFHSFIVKLNAGQAPRWVVIHCQITDTAKDELAESSHLAALPGDATWRTLDIDSVFNADVSSIYRQQYLSPRPNTVSVRIGTDGYSPWTFPYWKEGPPSIRTDSVNALTKSAGLIITPQRVPFTWHDGKKNIAFTSLWDNWPRSVEVPVGGKGDAVFMLICGSTNPMQCHIANASLHFHYADGSEDTLALVPPYNYWNLSPITKHDESGSAGQGNSRNDYTAWQDSFCVPRPWPETVQLGQNCRAMLLRHQLRPGLLLKSVSLHALSPEVVVGLMGVSILNPAKPENK